MANKPPIEPFLETLLSDARFSDFQEFLRRPDPDQFYEGPTWQDVDAYLLEYPDFANEIHSTIFKCGDDYFLYSIGNLKACYLVDEDFINKGRAFVLFNFVGSNWTYVGQLSNQLPFWKEVPNEH